MVEVLDNVNPDLSDSEFIEREEALDTLTPGVLGSEAGDAPTPGGDIGDGDGDEGEADEVEPEGDIDEELAAELDLALGDDEGADDDEDDDDDDDSEDDDDEDDEDAQERKLLNEEIRDLEAAVAKKQNEIMSSSNPLIKVLLAYFRIALVLSFHTLQKRFEDALKKLSADLEIKRVQHDEMKERQQRKKEGITGGDPDTDAEGGVQDGADADDNDVHDNNLFGADDAAMDIA